MAVSKNWHILKKIYFNHNFRSLDETLVRFAIFSLTLKLDVKIGEIILKIFSNKLIVVIRTLPTKVFTLYLSNITRLYWVASAISDLKKCPTIIHIKTLNSPYLNSKILGYLFQNQIKKSNLKKSLENLKMRALIINHKFTIRNPDFLICLVYLFHISRNFKLSKITNKNKNTRLRSHGKLENKLLIQKSYLKLSLIREPLNLRLILSFLILSPSYVNTNFFLQNIWLNFIESKKFTIGIKGWSLKFRGKLNKNPRKVKLSYNAGYLYNQKAKANITTSNQEFYIAQNGCSNVKFLINF